MLWSSSGSINPIQLEQCIDKALQKEASRVLSGQSDHENGSIEAAPGYPITSIPKIGSPTPLSSGEKAADKLCRERKQAKHREHSLSISQFSNSKNYKDVNPLVVNFNA